MNVQGASASIVRGERAPVGSGGVGATAAIAHLGAKTASGPAPSSNVASASRIAFAVSQTRLNQQVTGSQRSLAFLDKAGQQLLDLKGALASSLAGRPASRMEVDHGLNRVNAHWSGRHAATGGTLGSDLAFHEDGAAPQFFRIRGFEGSRRQATWAHYVEAAEHVRVLHADACSTVAAHGVAYEATAFAIWNGSVMCINICDDIVSDELLKIAGGDRARIH